MSFERSGKRPKSSEKLDELLRTGASGKKPPVDIDKAMTSTTHRLMKENIPFVQQNTVGDNIEQYRSSGFSVLEPDLEPLALRRIEQLVSMGKLPRDVLRTSLQTSSDSLKDTTIRNG